MSKRQFLVVLALAMMVIGLTWGWSRAFPQPSARIAIVHGTSLLSTDAKSGDINAAVQRFHDKFCKWVVDKNGRKSDPSFGQTASHWGAGALPGDMVFRRGITVFNDQQGKKVYIEQTQEAGRPTFIRIEYQGAGGPMIVTNALLAELQKLGVAVRRDEVADDAINAKQFIGRVVAVSKDGKSFTFEGAARDRPEESVKFEVKIGEKTAITYNAIRAGGAKPTAGYLVALSMDHHAKGLATKLGFAGKEGGYRGSDLTGIVTALDKDGKGFTLQVLTVEGVEARGEKKNVTIRFNEKTALSFDGVAEGEARIEEKQNAWIWYDDDATIGGNRIAGQVLFFGSAHSSSSRIQDIRGTLVSADETTLTVAQEVRGEEVTKRIVKIDQKTSFIFGNVGPDGAKRAAGQGVGIWLKDESKDTAADVALSGVAPERWETILGWVVGVSDDLATVTLEKPPAIRGENPKRFTIKLTSQTRTVYTNVGPDGTRPTVGDLGHVRLIDGSKDTAAQATFERLIRQHE